MDLACDCVRGNCPCEFDENLFLLHVLGNSRSKVILKSGACSEVFAYPSGDSAYRRRRLVLIPQHAIHSEL